MRKRPKYASAQQKVSHASHVSEPQVDWSNSVSLTRSTPTANYIQDWANLPSDLLQQHVGKYVATSSARLVCRNWANAVPIARLFVTSGKFGPSVRMPLAWNVPIKELVITDADSVDGVFPQWFSQHLCPLQRPTTLRINSFSITNDLLTSIGEMLSSPLCCIDKLTVADYGPDRYRVQRAHDPNWDPVVKGIQANGFTAIVSILSAMGSQSSALTELVESAKCPIKELTITSWRLTRNWNTAGKLTHLAIPLSLLSEDFFTSLASAATLRSLFIKLDCENLNGPLGTLFCTGIAVNRSVVALELSFHHLRWDQSFWKHFSTAISENTCLTSVSVRGETLSILGPMNGVMSHILEALQQKAQTIRRLDYLAPACELPPVDVFEPSLALEHLSMSYIAGCPVTTDLLEALSHLTSLRLVRVRNGNKSSLKDEALRSLKYFDSLRSLAVSAYKFDDFLDDLAELIVSTKKLESLELIGPWEVDCSAPKFFKALSQNSSIQNLVVNMPGSQHLASFAVALKCHTSIQRLEFESMSRYCEGDFVFFLESVAACPNLRKLRLSGLSIPKLTTLINIAPPTLQYLESLEHQDKETYRAAAEAITSFGRLKELFLGGYVTPEFAEIVLDGCENTLEEFTFSTRMMTPELNRAIVDSAAAVQAIVDSPTSTSWLQLRKN